MYHWIHFNTEDKTFVAIVHLSSWTFYIKYTKITLIMAPSIGRGKEAIPTICFVKPPSLDPMQLGYKKAILDNKKLSLYGKNFIFVVDAIFHRKCFVSPNMAMEHHIFTSPHISIHNTKCSFDVIQITLMHWKAIAIIQIQML